MMWLIVLAVLAWGPLSLGLGLLVGPALRRADRSRTVEVAMSGLRADATLALR